MIKPAAAVFLIAALLCFGAFQKASASDPVLEEQIAAINQEADQQEECRFARSGRDYRPVCDSATSPE